MVWGHGGCAINSTRYAGFLTTIASHGIVVLATAARRGKRGGDATPDHLRQAIDWAEAENRRRGSLRTRPGAVATGYRGPPKGGHYDRGYGPPEGRHDDRGYGAPEGGHYERGYSITTKVSRGNATVLAIESMMLIWQV